jgi:hypothetical protein
MLVGRHCVRTAKLQAAEWGLWGVLRCKPRVIAADTCISPAGNNSADPTLGSANEVGGKVSAAPRVWLVSVFLTSARGNHPGVLMYTRNE